MKSLNFKKIWLIVFTAVGVLLCQSCVVEESFRIHAAPAIAPIEYQRAEGIHSFEWCPTGAIGDKATGVSQSFALGLGLFQTSAETNAIFTVGEEFRKVFLPTKRVQPFISGRLLFSTDFSNVGYLRPIPNGGIRVFASDNFAFDFSVGYEIGFAVLSKEAKTDWLKGVKNWFYHAPSFSIGFTRVFPNRYKK